MAYLDFCHSLIPNDPHDLQTMLNIQMDHANKYRYIISDQKSCVLKIRDKTQCTWTMNAFAISVTSSATVGTPQKMDPI
jgi:hypothetical protein